jgi:hypothetical protein
MSLQKSRIKEYYNLERIQDKYLNEKRKITSNKFKKKLRIFFLSFFSSLLILAPANKSKKLQVCQGSKCQVAFRNRDFYFRALGSLVVLSFPQPLSFSSVLPKALV